VFLRSIAFFKFKASGPNRGAGILGGGGCPFILLYPVI
jgi:hypothetical protein